MPQREGLSLLVLAAVAVPLLNGCVTHGPSSGGSATPAPPRITVLYDAFGRDAAMSKDWGYAALIEYRGKRILFDTGNDPGILEHNARAAGADLSRLDFVVMSHRHGDHMGGMSYLLRVNPRVRIYAPKENFGVYGFSLPGSFYRQDPSLPAEQRYYDGSPPAIMKFGSAWPQANLELIENSTEIAPGFHLVALVSDKPTTLELRELSLVIDTPDGEVVVVGCSHPGIERIAAAAAAINPRIQLLVGGLHLVAAKDADIEKTVAALHDTYQVAYVAPGHCTGEPTFAALRKSFGERYLYAGVGTSIALGPAPHAIVAGNEAHEAGLSGQDLREYRALAANQELASAADLQ
jgi:7,8-dihydropterin-6-yl-methyl-4-(beta-D-ribofuranosyl)aminobenzene 5'-phosphate synthase